MNYLPFLKIVRLYFPIVAGNFSVLLPDWGKPTLI
jgi:hypothetical protein